MNEAISQPRILHIAANFGAGDPQAERCVQVAAALGRGLRHDFVAADGDWAALEQLPRGVTAQRRTVFPTLGGIPSPGRLQAIARQMVDAHLICTYGRGGVRAALAHTLFKDLLRLPPLIHHEDGSDETPRQRAGLRSTWARRVGLGKSAGLVVPTELMEGEALVRWQQPLGRVKTIPDGVDLDRFGAPPANARLPRLVKRAGERWILCNIGDASDAGIAALIACLADSDPAWHLVLSGAGDADRFAAPIAAANVDNRVHWIGAGGDATLPVRLADIVAVPGASAPLPRSAIEAMAAGKPVLAIGPGAIAMYVAADNAPFLAPTGDWQGLVERLQALIADPAMVARIGAANRARAEAERSEQTMVAAYRRLYASAMQRDTI